MKKQAKLLAIPFLLISMFTSCSEEKRDSSKEVDLKIDKYVEYWNTGQYDGIKDLLCEDFEVRMTPLFESEKGIDLFMENVTNVRKSYPDFHITGDEIIYSTNAVAVRWTIHATSKTRKEMNVKGMSIFHFVDGKIKDEWISNNDLLWLQQLGYTITPPSTDEDE